MIPTNCAHSWRRILRVHSNRTLHCYNRYCPGCGQIIGSAVRMPRTSGFLEIVTQDDIDWDRDIFWTEYNKKYARDRV